MYLEILYFHIYKGQPGSGQTRLEIRGADVPLIPRYLNRGQNPQTIKDSRWNAQKQTSSFCR
ncbi:hypothetical protein I7I48_09074 [Histoplasma ohiense]|nr:hypothetical protein I7I48_09074 [Histoplasma ohiense (nom. inval.)]